MVQPEDVSNAVRPLNKPLIWNILTTLFSISQGKGLGTSCTGTGCKSYFLGLLGLVSAGSVEVLRDLSRFWGIYLGFEIFPSTPTERRWKKYCFCGPCSTEKWHYWHQLSLFFGLLSEEIVPIKESLPRGQLKNRDTRKRHDCWSFHIKLFNTGIKIDFTTEIVTSHELPTRRMWENTRMLVSHLGELPPSCGNQWHPKFLSNFIFDAKCSQWLPTHLQDHLSIKKLGPKSLLNCFTAQDWTFAAAVMSVFSHCDYHCSPQLPHSFSVYSKQAPNGKYITFWAAQTTPSMTPTAINSKSNIFNELGKGWNTTVFYLW